MVQWVKRFYWFPLIGIGINGNHIQSLTIGLRKIAFQNMQPYRYERLTKNRHILHNNTKKWWRAFKLYSRFSITGRRCPKFRKRGGESFKINLISITYMSIHSVCFFFSSAGCFSCTGKYQLNYRNKTFKKSIGV